jgi:RimJ/RimL family protein N-acetyltransferase
LKDGTRVILKLNSREDFEFSLGFFRRQPEEDRVYLRRDVTKREVIEQRVCEIESGLATVIIALADGMIVGDVLLQIPTRGWYRKTGEVRLVTDTKYRRRGLGILLLQEIIEFAKEKGLNKLEATCMDTQIGIQKTLETLGFEKEGELKDFVVDLKGNEHNLILMGMQLKQV